MTDAAVLPMAALAAGSDPAWLTVALLGLLAGLLAMDETAVAQTWLSSPLTAAVAAGWLAGDVTTGLALGLPLQLALAGNLPVGQSFTGDPAPAVVGVVGAAVLSGNHVTPALRDGTAADLPLLGWLVLAAGLASMAGHPLVQAERRAHVLWMLEGHRTLRDGSLARIDRLHARCLVATLLRGWVFGVLFLLLVLRVWLPLFHHLPPRVLAALGLLPLLVAAVGIGALAERYGRRSWRWLAGGVLLAAVAAQVFG
jgi:mannose/fructose/N-acetylgalactosamine-specific phosphotransferase system component IIC